CHAPTTQKSLKTARSKLKFPCSQLCRGFFCLNRNASAPSLLVCRRVTACLDVYLRYLQSTGPSTNVLPDCLPKPHRLRIADLPIFLRRRTANCPIFWKGLQPGIFLHA